MDISCAANIGIKWHMLFILPVFFYYFSFFYIFSPDKSNLYVTFTSLSFFRNIIIYIGI